MKRFNLTVSLHSVANRYPLSVDLQSFALTLVRMVLCAAGCLHKNKIVIITLTGLLSGTLANAPCDDHAAFPSINATMSGSSWSMRFCGPHSAAPFSRLSPFAHLAGALTDIFGFTANEVVQPVQLVEDVECLGSAFDESVVNINLEFRLYPCGVADRNHLNAPYALGIAATNHLK